VWVDALDFKVKLASASADGGPNIDMIAFDIKGVYRTGCKPAKVENDVESSSSGESSIVWNKPLVSAVSFDALNRSVATPGGLMEVQLMDAMGKILKRELRNVPSGLVPMLSSGVRLPKGRYFVRISLNGKLALMRPVSW
jgi:hypothetical protein